MTLVMKDTKNLEIGDIEVGAIKKIGENRARAGSIVLKKSYIESEGEEKAIEHAVRDLLKVLRGEEK